MLVIRLQGVVIKGKKGRRSKCKFKELIAISPKSQTTVKPRVEFTKKKGFSQGTKQTVRDNDVSVKRGSTVLVIVSPSKTLVT